MKNIFHLSTLILPFLIIGCHTGKKLATTDLTMERRVLDTIEVRAERITANTEQDSWSLPTYNPSATKLIDLLHTSLDIRFDLQNQWVLGRAELKIKPWFAPIQQIELDAVNFDIHSVRLMNTGLETPFRYDGQKLIILLSRPYSRNEEIDLFIHYTAKPAEIGESMQGAISSNQGLFFINPDGKENKPFQIWTQGETEYNSHWFPTVDKPNERCTQEISITVDSKLKTLSNGLLNNSKINPDNTRTDTWVMDMPHAPYLFMLAIGDFAVVEEEWNGKPLYYYVEPEYEEDAKAIFAHTPEMLSFFSDILDYPFPWPKYAQVVVRDYVSGAMENTTAVIFGDFVQQKKRALIDDNNDGIVAHEMFHHWFGDLVTCESWANLTLNEGFASYSEYLWDEHKYGRNQADYNRQNDLSGYFSEAARNAHRLIYYDYPDKEATFDAHSYNKGGLVLHMLRKMIGDEAFFASLNKYLTDNAYSDVEIDELRIAFEEVTGSDLKWFFDQWYLQKGHPQLTISHQFDSLTQEYQITITQTQDPLSFPPVFQLPFFVDFYEANGKVQRESVFLNQRKQTFRFNLSSPPAFVNVDAEDALLAEINDSLPERYLLAQYHFSPLYRDRMEALVAAEKSSDAETFQSLINKALSDPFWGIRQLAVRLTKAATVQQRQPLEQLASKDPHSRVRAEALNTLAASGDPRYIQLAQEVLMRDSAYRCITAALNLLQALDINTALQYANKMEPNCPEPLLSTIGSIYAAKGNAEFAPFFEKNWDKVKGFGVFDFFGQYVQLVRIMPEMQMTLAIDNLKKIATDDQSPLKRFAVTNSLYRWKKEITKTADEESETDTNNSLLVDKLNQIIAHIISKESNNQLLNYYRNF